MPEFSIIIPIYKVEKYLRECVDSILNQDYTDFEVILVDDGSPDGCPQICDEYAAKDSRVKVIHQQNSGVSAARNNGIEAASGRYFWFVDGDDGITDGAFEVIKSYLGFDFDVLDFGDIPDGVKAEDNEINNKKYALIHSRDDIEKLMSHANDKRFMHYSWKKIFKASFIKDNGIRFDSRLSYGEDSVFNFEAYIRADKIIFSEDWVYKYRDRDDSASKTIEGIFKMDFISQLELNCAIRDELYEKYSGRYTKSYYENKGFFVLEQLLIFVILKKIYGSSNRNKYRIFRTVSSSAFVRDCFKNYDINKAKRKSLEWRVLWAIKYRLFFLGHILCKYVLYK